MFGKFPGVNVSVGYQVEEPIPVIIPEVGSKISFVYENKTYTGELIDWHDVRKGDRTPVSLTIKVRDKNNKEYTLHSWRTIRAITNSMDYVLNTNE